MDLQQNSDWELSRSLLMYSFSSNIISTNDQVCKFKEDQKEKEETKVKRLHSWVKKSNKKVVKTTPHKAIQFMILNSVL
ncbi:unnamed protein product [Hymenolepis diminuta]|uniref:Uncharacterized protein n=1 Tax=Hymenolepis diminuta TaxID=6216 RepID=A0A3P7A426_HYMDI|nr:unnamed protein product [Hymenolepis diminuta]